MFIRAFHTSNKETGAVYTTHRLMESYRTDRGPRQRIVMHLGQLKVPKPMWRRLADLLEARLAGTAHLFEDDQELAREADVAQLHHQSHTIRTRDRESRESAREMLTIDANSVAVTESRSLGPELVGHAVWERLGFDQILGRCRFSEMESALAQAVVVGRLIEPSSDLATWQWLSGRTALVELLPGDLGRAGKDAVYEIADRLLLHKREIERFLRQRAETLFDRKATLFLYDLTNTYFEGRCLGNSLAKRGPSKEKRSDCPLATLALAVDELGFPLLSNIYAGNQSEPPTLKDVLTELKKEAGGLFDPFDQEEKPTIVMDRGLATKENLKLLKDELYPYIVIERRQVEKQYQAEFTTARETFQKISGREAKEDVYVKQIPYESGARVLCLSEGRERKESGIDTLKQERFLADLTRLQATVSKGRLRNPAKVNQRIGRLRERYPSIAKYYQITLQLDENSPKAPKTIAVTFQQNEARRQRSLLTGCYVIEASHSQLPAQQLWELYMMLSRVEAAFRSLKTDLGFRPIYHQLEERTKAHLFISVLAYHLLICIERQLRIHGDPRSWSTLRSQLATHQRTTVIMTDDQKLIHHIRVSGQPEPLHRDIYRLLDVKDPLRNIHDRLAHRL